MYIDKMSLISVETLIVQTLGFAVAISWSDAIGTFSKTLYTGSASLSAEEADNIKKRSRVALINAFTITMLITIIVFIVNRAGFLFTASKDTTILDPTKNKGSGLGPHSKAVDLVLSRPY
jgi:hypothetical protein